MGRPSDSNSHLLAGQVRGGRATLRAVTSHTREGGGAGALASVRNTQYQGGVAAKTGNSQRDRQASIGIAITVVTVPNSGRTAGDGEVGEPDKSHKYFQKVLQDPSWR